MGDCSTRGFSATAFHAVDTPGRIGERRPDEMGRRRGEYKKAVKEFKRIFIERALCRTGWNRTEAAKALGIQRTYLLRLMRGLRVAAPARGSGGSVELQPIGVDAKSD